LVIFVAEEEDNSFTEHFIEGWIKVWNVDIDWMLIIDSQRVIIDSNSSSINFPLNFPVLDLLPNLTFCYSMGFETIIGDLFPIFKLDYCYTKDYY
jgi:hypothetical protein